MAPRFSILSLFHFLLALSATVSVGFCDPSGDELVAELESLRSTAHSGVIHLDDHLVSRFLTSVTIPRPYHLIIFFDSASHRSHAELRLLNLLSEFAIVSESFAAHHRGLPSASKLFFCDLEFGKSEASFYKFGINFLPHIRLVSPTTKSLNESDSLDGSAFSRLADAMAEFIESNTNLPVGPILRPKPAPSRLQPVLLIVLLIAAPFIIKKILSGQTLLHDSRAWMAGAVLVYFFSVSGSMHNIIRKIPMTMTDRDGRPVYFYQGSGMQLGAEGFIVGFLYTVAGLVLASVTHDLVRLKSVMEQRGLMLVSLFVMSWAVWKVIYFDSWKTGYGVQASWLLRRK